MSSSSMQQLISSPSALTSAAAPVGKDYVSKNNYSFIGWGISPAVSAQYSYVQIINPVGSGKTVYVDRVHVSQSSSGTIELRQNVVAGTLIGNFGSKAFGGSNSSAQCKYGPNASLLGSKYCHYDYTAGTSLELVFDPPITLNEGQALTFNPSAANVAIAANFEFREY